VRILSALGAAGPLRMSDLAARADLDAPLLTREVQGLINAGYVNRRTDPGDGRVAIVALTSRGVTATEAYRSAVETIVAETFGRWSASDLRTLAGMLERVAADSARPPRPASSAQPGKRISSTRTPSGSVQ
jgi:DNA-binding MarR family transcriptional regulator